MFLWVLVACLQRVSPTRFRVMIVKVSELSAAKFWDGFLERDTPYFRCLCDRLSELHAAGFLAEASDLLEEDWVIAGASRIPEEVLKFCARENVCGKA